MESSAIISNIRKHQQAYGAVKHMQSSDGGRMKWQVGDCYQAQANAQATEGAFLPMASSTLDARMHLKV
jgi:hypothetical protein